LGPVSVVQGRTNVQLHLHRLPGSGWQGNLQGFLFDSRTVSESACSSSADSALLLQSKNPDCGLRWHRRSPLDPRATSTETLRMDWRRVKSPGNEPMREAK